MQDKKEEKKAYDKIRYKNKREEISLKRKGNYSQTREYNLKRCKEYYKNNKNKKNEYLKIKRKTDPLFKLSSNIRTRIRDSFRRNGFSKTNTTLNILGCSFEQFKTHLESKFEHWMNWDNHGLYNGQTNFGWDVDHIIPVSSGLSEDEMIKLNHYTNLQPLCSYTNRHVKKHSLIWN